MKPSIRAKVKLAYILMPLLFITLSCSTVTPVSTDGWWEKFEPGHSADEILSDFNLHRGKWWNYYARGCWFAEGEFWDDAITDFKRALAVRSKDGRAARSYGMHFWDYFARRELGVCYYNVGKYDAAVEELEASLQTADSSKAKFYLNKARLAVLSGSNVDQRPPEIVVASHTDGGFVNSPSINLAGAVNDDYFSGGVWINNRKLFIELAAKELRFEETVRLKPGENAVAIKASDLVGNQVSSVLNLTLDLRSPVILMDEIPDIESLGQRTLSLKGSIMDDYGIGGLWINGKEVDVDNGKEVVINETVDISAADAITLRAVDLAGNEVKGTYPLDRKAVGRRLLHNGLSGAEYAALIEGAASRMSPSVLESVGATAMLASVDNSLAASALEQGGGGVDVSSGAAAGGATPPKISTDLKAVTVYEDYYVVSGEVHDSDGISNLTINGEAITGNSSKHLFFNHILTLSEGANPVTIVAQDVSGGKSELPTVNVDKKTFEFMETDSRYTVALMPFKRIGIAGMATDSVYAMLMQSFEKEPKRFNFVERDRSKLLEVLKEQKMSNEDMAATENVIKIGKIRSAEGMLFGTVVEDDKGLNVSLNLVDTETTKVIATSDVYGEDKSVDNLRWMMKGLALKMKQRFPMLQGTVVYVSKKGFFVDFGSDSGATLGMKFLLFREVDLGMMKIKEPLDAVAQIVQVDKQACMARIIDGADAIEKKDLVITR